MAQAFAELRDHLEGQRPALVGLLIEEAQCFDLVLVFLQVVRKFTNGLFCLFGCACRESSKDHLVHVQVVNDLFSLSPGVFNGIAQVWTVEQGADVFQALLPCVFQFLRGQGVFIAKQPLLSGYLQGCFHNSILVHSHQQRLAKLSYRNASAGFLDACFCFFVQLSIHSDESTAQRLDDVVIAVTHDQVLHESFQGNVRGSVQTSDFCFEFLFNADGIDQYKAVFGAVGTAADALQSFGVQAAYAPAFHLLVVAAAANITHEQKYFQRLHVGAGGNHVHGDGNAGVVVIAKA